MGRRVETRLGVKEARMQRVWEAGTPMRRILTRLAMQPFLMPVAARSSPHTSPQPLTRRATWQERRLMHSNSQPPRGLFLILGDSGANTEEEQKLATRQPPRAPTALLARGRTQVRLARRMRHW